MSFFGDEPRFEKKIHIRDGHVIFTKETTADRVGPGQYYNQSQENARGWKSEKKSFTNREPFKPDSKERDRANHYIAGVLMNSGIAVHGYTSDQVRVNNPGPGHYNVTNNTIKSPRSPSKSVRSAGGEFGNTFMTSASANTSLFGTSKRMTANNSVLRDGIFSN